MQKTDSRVLKTVEKKLKELRLKKTKNDNLTLLLAVSGGADSIAMLHAVAECNRKLNNESESRTLCALQVITVDHKIREAKESAGDAQFVIEECKKLGIKYTLAELKEGEVYDLAKLRKSGIEESARFLRYREFEKTAELIKADYILTAHNKNDYYETILMRLFQGADSEALFGIAEYRDNFFRPLLELSRAELESYLKENNIAWREDSSNEEQAFLRNKIRHNLIPALNLSFDSWQSGLDKSLEKIKLNSDFVNSAYKEKLQAESWKKNENTLECKFDFFNSLDEVLRLKFIQDGVNLLNAHYHSQNVSERNQETSVRARIPYSVFKDFLKISTKNTRVISGAFCLEKKGDSLIFSRTGKERLAEMGKTRVYSFWIEKGYSGHVSTPAGDFIIERVVDGDAFLIKLCNDDSRDGIGVFSYPVCIRSKVLGDEIKMPNGKTKLLKKILNEWKLSEEERMLVPIIEEKGIVKAVYGKIFGRKNIIAGK